MLKVFIEYKGKIFKFNIFNDFKDYKYLKVIHVLITDKNAKNSYNYHFICDTKTGNVIIPSTSCDSGCKESSHLIINFKPNEIRIRSQELEVNGIKFDIPIHSIYELGEGIPTNLNFTVDFNV